MNQDVQFMSNDWIIVNELLQNYTYLNSYYNDSFYLSLTITYSIKMKTRHGNRDWLIRSYTWLNLPIIGWNMIWHELIVLVTACKKDNNHIKISMRSGIRVAKTDHSICRQKSDLKNDLLDYDHVIAVVRFLPYI